jgi:hypothetical protein
MFLAAPAGGETRHAVPPYGNPKRDNQARSAARSSGRFSPNYPPQKRLGSPGAAELFSGVTHEA